jgi:hypothetical protein
MVLRIKIPVDRDDREATVTLDPNEVLKAVAGQGAGACVVITRECGNPLHVRAVIERVAA